MTLKIVVVWFLSLITVILAQQYFPTYVNGTNYERGGCNSISNSTTYLGQDGICHERKDINEICSTDDECLWEGHFLKCIHNTCRCEEGSKIETFNKSGTWVDETRDFLVYKQNVRSPFSSNLRKLNPEFSFWTQPHVLANDTGTIIYGYYLNDINSTVGRLSATVRTNFSPVIVVSQCVGLAKHKCNPEGKCVANATCLNNTTTAGEPICMCSRPYIPTSSGSCGVARGERCNGTQQCADTLLCTHSVCECPSSQHYYYDYNVSRCLGLISTFCSLDSECTNNAICEFNLETKRKQCNCKQGYIENEAGHCDVAWNSTCEIDTFEKCDTLANLKCRNGFCLCPDDMGYYNVTSRSCQYLVGSRCYPSSICVDGAACKAKHPKLTGRCLCKAGYEVIDNQLCTKILDLDNPETYLTILT